MKKIIIAVGSTRKPKLGAVQEAAALFAPAFGADCEFEVVGVEVESGVSHTPASRRELMLGARLRAEAVQRAAAAAGQRWDYFAGLEGGLDAWVEEGGRRVFLESWAYVTDGERGYYGRSAGIELPEELAAEVLDKGVELSEAIDRYAAARDVKRFGGASGIRNAQGAWGVLSADLVTRQEAFREAVVSAFAPFYNARMYQARAGGAAEQGKKSFPAA